MAGSTVLSAARAVRRDIDPDTVAVASTERHPEYEGKTLTEIGAIIGVADPHEIVARFSPKSPSPSPSSSAWTKTTSAAFSRTPSA